MFSLLGGLAPHPNSVKFRSQFSHSFLQEEKPSQMLEPQRHFPVRHCLIACFLSPSLPPPWGYGICGVRGLGSVLQTHPQLLAHSRYSAKTWIMLLHDPHYLSVFRKLPCPFSRALGLSSTENSEGSRVPLTPLDTHPACGSRAKQEIQNFFRKKGSYTKGYMVYCEHQRAVRLRTFIGFVQQSS